MKLHLAFVALILIALPVRTLMAQATPPPTATPPKTGELKGANEPRKDIYGDLGDVADQYWADYERIRKAKLGEVQRLLDTKRCQTDKIRPLIAQALDALNLWYPEEALYWKKWHDFQSEKVQQLLTTQQDYIARQAEALAIKNADDDDLRYLIKRFDDSDGATKDPEILRRKNDLQAQIQQKKADIAAIDAQYIDLGEKIKALGSNYDVELINISTQIREVDRSKAAELVLWDQKGNEAEVICGSKKPTATPTVAPAAPQKGGRGQE